MGTRPRGSVATSKRDLFFASGLAVRVVGGYLGSRILVSPSRGVRPTSDRVRESLFARLGDLSQVRVLDVYSGIGSLGIESISRGAAHVVFIDRAVASLRALRKNLEALDLEGVSEVIRGDAQPSLRRLGRQGREFDLIFLDPPYDSDEVTRSLRAVREARLLATEGAVVIETAKRHSFPMADGFVILDQRSTGDTLITRLVADVTDEASSTGCERPQRPVREREESPEVSKKKLSATTRRQTPGGPPGTTVALFPASFDPMTNGHLDLIERACRIFDEVIVAVAINVGKTGTFSFDERLEMLNEVLAGHAGVRVQGFSGLVVEYAREIGATVILRGLRASADFEYEFEMALMNRHLDPDLEVLYMMTRQEHLYVSSSRLKELVRFGANIDDFVPPIVSKNLNEKLARI